MVLNCSDTGLQPNFEPTRATDVIACHTVVSDSMGESLFWTTGWPIFDLSISLVLGIFAPVLHGKHMLRHIVFDSKVLRKPEANGSGSLIISHKNCSQQRNDLVHPSWFGFTGSLARLRKRSFVGVAVSRDILPFRLLWEQAMFTCTIWCHLLHWSYSHFKLSHILLHHCKALLHLQSINILSSSLEWSEII